MHQHATANTPLTFTYIYYVAYPLNCFMQHALNNIGPVVSLMSKTVNPVTSVGFEVLTAVFMEEFYLLPCNTVYSVEIQPTFQRNMSPPTRKSNNKGSKKPA
jgi:hypothetical protein